ncbi:PREDICTED: disease resistance protein TAO1-like [Camelina sativa]|uniref:Disease resistance protein TAO1-like n=1 Tax=Camelina sativa TaxID=90675 RepID=A0ABM0X7E9_CAMSA|nr:PREDICTED: disease resistance protein TAO1-like [Camelina sativa]
MISKMYMRVGFPSRVEALQIFSQSAFRQDSPADGYVELSNEVAKLTRLPLGLSVLGSSLRGKSKTKWIRALPSLKATLHVDIERILRIGYDSLGDNDDLKVIFLHIACVFNGGKKKRVTQLLGNSDLDIESGLDVLVERALISISSDKRITMHNLLQQMGRQIVRRQSTHEPGKRQFLVDAKTINDVLADNTGTRTVLGISFNMSEIEELFLGKGAFVGMYNLQILRFYKQWSDKARLHLDEGLDCLSLPPRLRLLHWEMKCMQTQLSANFLVEINMRESKLEKLWQGDPMLKCLKKINLCASVNLKELPDLSKATNLERIELTRCRSLAALPSSFGKLQKLNYLHLGECINLESFPANLALMSLSFLNICECSKLKDFPEISSKIVCLSASFTTIREVPLSVQHWNRLKRLTMICCETVTTFPLLPATVSKLYLDYSRITEIPSWIKNLYGLKILSMTYCEQLQDISPNICKLIRLQKLNFTGCINVRKFPVEIFQSFNFKHELLLRLDNVQAKSLPANIPEKIHSFPLKLYMSENDFKSIPHSIKHLSHLHSLHLHDCVELVSLPELPDSLSELHAENCRSLESISQPCNSYHNPKLILKFNNCVKLIREARKLLIEEWACGYAILPGGEVPEYFSHQARGSSLTIHLDHMHLSGSMKFKACVVLPARDWPNDVPASCIQISCHLRGNHSTSVYKWPYIDVSYTFEKDHLFILNSYFTLEQDNIPEDKLRFDFGGLPCKILRCGVQFLEACPCKYDYVAHPKYDYVAHPILSSLPLEDSVVDMDYEDNKDVGETALQTRRSTKRKRPSSSEEPEKINKKLCVSIRKAAKKLEKSIQRQEKNKKTERLNKKLSRHLMGYCGSLSEVSHDPVTPSGH